jgi:hypothetical protein
MLEECSRSLYANSGWKKTSKNRNVNWYIYMISKQKELPSKCKLLCFILLNMHKAQIFIFTGVIVYFSLLYFVWFNDSFLLTSKQMLNCHYYMYIFLEWGIFREKHWLLVSHWQTWKLEIEPIVIGTDCISRCKSNYHTIWGHDVPTLQTK